MVDVVTADLSYTCARRLAASWCLRHLAAMEPCRLPALASVPMSKAACAGLSSRSGSEQVETAGAAGATRGSGETDVVRKTRDAAFPYGESVSVTTVIAACVYIYWETVGQSEPDKPEPHAGPALVISSMRNM